VITVKGFHESGKLHVHGLTGVPADKLGQPVDWKGEQTYLRKQADRYGLGRIEFKPVRDPVAYAVYLLKHLAQTRAPEFREDGRGYHGRCFTYLGAMQWVRYRADGTIATKGKLPEFCRAVSPSFRWANGPGRDWRERAQAFATMMYDSDAIAEPTAAGLRAKFGARWFLQWGRDIERMDLDDPGSRPWPPLTYRELRELVAADRRAHPDKYWSATAPSPPA
jgi:hypothetical protein